MNTQECDLTVVWNGTMGHDGIYLGALKGVEPFMVKEPASITAPKEPTAARPIGDLIVRLLTERGPMTQSQLASACNRAAGETRKVMRRLAKRGAIMLVQPCLLAIDPHAGQLWRRT